MLSSRQTHGSNEDLGRGGGAKPMSGAGFSSTFTQRRWLPAFPLALCSQALSAATITLAQLSAVSVSSDREERQLIVEALFVTSARPHDIRHFKLENPERLVIDLFATDTSPNLRPELNTASGVLRDVRVGRHSEFTRIVLDLEQSAEKISASQLAECPSNTEILRVCFDLASVTRETEKTEQSHGAITQDTSAPDELGKIEGYEQSSVASTQERSSNFLVFGGQKSESASPVSDITSKQNATAVGDAKSRFTIDRWLLESGVLDSEGGDGTNNHFQAIAYLDVPDVADRISLRVGARLDGRLQTGNLEGYSSLKADYDESWFRYSLDDWTFTAGAQRIIWGRTDEYSPTDRLSTRDYTRLTLDPLEYRRRANPALRLQRSVGNSSLDLVWLPTFREAELPDRDSIWFPVNTETGTVAGLPIPSTATPLLENASVNNDPDGEAGFGLRFSKNRAAWDYALTVQRVNNPEPYFTLASLPSEGAPAVLNAVYPRTWVVGGDLGVTLGSYTLRAEVAWLDDSPYTRSEDFSLALTEELNWAVGIDAFPGAGSTRVTAQINGRHLLDPDSPVDFVDVLTLIGDAESEFNFGRWPMRASFRYAIRLDEEGYYFNPEITFTGAEPNEVYFGAHLFDGSYGTAEGFYQDFDTIVLGWRAAF